MAEVTLERVNKRFDQVVAVRDANLTIHDKEFVVFVGPAARGKTTTLRMIAGLEEITSGTIKIFVGGRLERDSSDYGRRFGVVDEDGAVCRRPPGESLLHIGTAGTLKPQDRVST